MPTKSTGERNADPSLDPSLDQLYLRFFRLSVCHPALCDTLYEVTILTVCCELCCELCGDCMM